jgi:penicillin-binding protein 1A
MTIDNSNGPSEGVGPGPNQASVVAGSSGTPGGEARAPRRTRFWSGVLAGLRLSGLLMLLGLGGGALAVFFTVRHFERNLPSVVQLKRGYDPPQVTRVLARDGTVLANVFTERRTVIDFGSVPAHAKLAFLAAEDAHFYEHEGLNYFGMLRALVANLRAGKTRQGGSTITQQVIKNVLLDSERSYRRKIRETILARRLEQNLTKDEIFWLYLNHIYFGHGCYGVEEAARYYFGKPAQSLELAEAALLAGLVAAPERFSPRHAPEKALERRSYVLGQMLEKQFVTRELYQQALQARLQLAPAVERESELAPEMVAYAKKALEQVVGERAARGGFTVTTSLDPELQAEARKAVRENLDRFLKRQKLLPPFRAGQRRPWGAPADGTPKPNKIYVGVVTGTDDRTGTIDLRVGSTEGRVWLANEERYNPAHLPPSKFAETGALLRVSLLAGTAGGTGPVPVRLELGPDSALVAIDVRSREVRALVGSYAALPGGLDRALHAHRQPGSAFKAFVYSYALHARRFAPSSVLELPGPSEEAGKRQLTLRQAIAKSDNAAAQFLLEQVGAPNVVVWAHALGIESELGATPSLALGAYEVTPLELVNGHVTLASGGDFAAPVLINKITGPEGAALPLPALPPARKAMEPEEAYLTTSLLRGVVEMGTAQKARVLGRPLAGKTGTTNQARDAWFVGYSPDLVAGVWVGYDDSLPLGAGEQGGATALPAWIDFMRAAHARRPPADFPRPSNIQRVRVDPATGLLAYDDQEDGVEEEFLPGTAPTVQAERDAGPPDSGVPEEAGVPEDAEAVPVLPGDASTSGESGGRDGAGQTEEPPPF